MYFLRKHDEWNNLTLAGRCLQQVSNLTMFSIAVISISALRNLPTARYRDRYPVMDYNSEVSEYRPFWLLYFRIIIIIYEVFALSETWRDMYIIFKIRFKARNTDDCSQCPVASFSVPCPNKELNISACKVPFLQL